VVKRFLKGVSPSTSNLFNLLCQTLTDSPEPHSTSQLIFHLQSKHALKWIRRRLAESISLSGTSAEREEEGDFMLSADQSRRLKKALYYNLEPHQLEEDSPVNVPSLLDLHVELISGGATNVCVRVWFDPTLNRSSVDKQMDQFFSKQYPPGVFVKVAPPYARWAGPKKKCDVSRLDNEFRCLERLGSICPGISTVPIICGSDEVENDGSRYLVTEFLPGQWEQYNGQFKRGHVDTKVAESLGFSLAKVHILSPTRFKGKDGILNATTLDFISKGHYGKLLQDTTFELERTDFFNERTGEIDKDAMRFKEYLKSNPELFRALSRHYDNFVNPPPETATFAHLDSHVCNILVPVNGMRLDNSSIKSCLQGLASAERYDVSKECVFKLIDMEFSNWGPSGADIGLFVSCVLFYSLCHACGDKEVDTNSIISTIPAIWNAYTDAYAHFARDEGRSDKSVIRSLYFIAREVLGWAGVWMFRFSAPKLFRLCLRCDLMYTLPTNIYEKLRSRQSSSGDVDGVAIFRSHVNCLAGKVLTMGFGDSALEEVPEIITMEHCNGIIESLVKEITWATQRMRHSIRETDARGVKS